MFPTAFIILVGFIGSALTIFEFVNSRIGNSPKRSQILAAVFGSVTIVLVVISVIFANVLSPQGGSGPGIAPTSTVNTQPTGTGNTPTQAQATPTPTPPSVGTILYQADSAWSGWHGTKDWKVNGGLLLNDGTYGDYNSHPTIVAPYQLPTADYAIDLQMQVVSAFTTGTIYPCFYIAIRGTASSNGWQGYAAVTCVNLGHGPAVQIVAVDSSNNIFDVLSTTPFDPQNAWHSYRVEAKGTTIKFFVDGGLLLSADDSRYLNAGQIGLWSELMQVKLSSFKITAL